MQHLLLVHFNLIYMASKAFFNPNDLIYLDAKHITTMNCKISFSSPGRTVIPVDAKPVIT